MDENSGALILRAQKTVVAPASLPEAQQREEAAAEAPQAADAGTTGATVVPKAAEAARQPAPGADTTWLRAERAFGRIERVLSLPSDADVGRITASLGHGVLSLTIPKVPRAGSGSGGHEHGRHRVEIA